VKPSHLAGAVLLAAISLYGVSQCSAQDKPASQPTSRPAPSKDGLPREFIRVLPRGRIAAVMKPRYVKASEAEIRPDAWILGVVIGGEARAYSLNLLNRHEIVNDTIAGTAFAAVW
jgi:hypothetical protein